MELGKLTTLIPHETQTSISRLREKQKTKIVFEFFLLLVTNKGYLYEKKKDSDFEVTGYIDKIMVRGP